jgi:uncharacterized protein with GYD domain
MPKFLFEGKYSVDGVKGLLKEGGSARRAAAEKAAQSVGGKLDGAYFDFGESDFFAIFDMPDNATMTALALTIGASGAGTTKTTVLMTPEEVDAAVKKSPNYRPPGH